MNRKPITRCLLRKLTAVALLCALSCGLTGGALAAELIDGLGRTVTVAEAPQRIVALPVWAAEMLLEMVGPERIAAVSPWGDDPVLSPAAELAASVPARVTSSTPEDILALNPDLVVLDTYSAGFDGALVQTLQDAGLTVLCLNSPTDLIGVMEALTLLGQATGAQEQAAQMLEGMQATLHRVSLALAKLPPESYKTVMFMEDYYDPNGSTGTLCAYGPGSTFDAIAQAAGLVNVCDAPNYSPVNKEMVVAQWKPQVIIVPSSTYDAEGKMIDDGGAANIAAVLADPTLATLQAVQDGMVFAIPDKYRGSTSQHMAQAVLELASLLYPIE